MDLSLRGYVTAVVRAQTHETMSEVADQLGRVAELVTSSPELATALSDVAVPTAARQAVVRDLFEAKVADPVMRIVSHAVGTEHPSDLLSALHGVGELARLLTDFPAEAEEADDRPLGRGALRRLLGGMVAAELEPLPDVAAIEDVEDELFRVARIVAATPPLAAALADWSVPSARRAELITDLLAGKATEATIRLLAGAVRLRTRDVAAMVQWLAEQAAAARGWRVARVRAAMELDGSARDRLGEAMARLTGRPVEVQVTVDPALLGGARVEIGDLLVDATTRHRLDQLEEQLRSPEGVARALLGEGDARG